ncbi:BatD family protein [Bdellovibrio sp. HCB337]|uniref:BatD family protein n=1 Tax=Bdellovibrio sp. HCB337 TaxID=3394358 RepID=UPI0039A65CA4
MTKIGNYFCLCLLLVSVALPAWAKVTVQSIVDRNEMSVGDSFTLTVSVQSDESVDAQEPRAPDLEGFELLNSWQSSSTSQKLMNTSSGMKFEVQRRKDFNYLLAPRKAGTYTVGAFEVVVDGKVYNSQPITLSVGAQGSAPPRGGGGQQGQRPRRAMPPGFGNMPGQDMLDEMDRAEEEIFNQLLQRRQQQVPPGYPGGPAAPRANQPEPQFRSLPTNPNEAFFIQVEVDKTEVFEGEQVTASWYLYTRGQMESLDRLKFPDLKGFWKEIIEEVPSIQFSEEIINGVVYKRALLASHALFPIKPGTAVIDEYKIKSRVRMPNQNFGGFGFGQAYEYTKSSQRVKIKVNPLPIDNRPKDFSGAVGQFDVNASVDSQNILVNQAFSLKVRFEGNGNAKLIELPAIEWPKTVEVYDTKSDAKFFKNGRSYKEFEVLLIPRQEGELRIPAISVGTFDPQAKKYVNRQTQEIVLNVEANPNAPSGNVTGGPVAPGAAAPQAGKAPVNNLSGKVLPDLIMAWDEPGKFKMASQPMFWGGIYALVGLFLVWRSKVELGWGRRRQNLRDLVNKRYKKLDGLLKKNDYRGIGAEMMNIFNLVLGSISGQEASGLDLDKMLERIPPSLRREHGETLKKQYEVFQVMSFAPENMLGTYKEASTVQKEVGLAKDLLQKLINSNPEQHELQ